MPTDNLTKELKVRVKPAWGDFLADYAKAENLKVSDIARRAIHEFIGRHRRRKAK